MNTKEKGSQLEEFVHYVYHTLLRNENLREVKIQKNCIKIGRSGAKHEFDIFYEVKIAGILHSVAIECKNHNRAITQGMILEFTGKLNQFNNIQGIFISALGYQEGAQKLAAENGIILMKEADLPRINELLADSIRVGMLPNKNIKGDPFWVIMEELNDNNTTGTYYDFGEETIMLFLSKKSAERMMSRKKITNFGVFGVSRQQLRAICCMAKVMKYKLCICSTLLRKEDEHAIGWEYSGDALLDEYIN